MIFANVRHYFNKDVVVCIWRGTPYVVVAIFVAALGGVVIVGMVEVGPVFCLVCTHGFAVLLHHFVHCVKCPVVYSVLFMSYP